MSVLRYFRLRPVQQVLCLSYSAPVAIFLTVAFSPLGSRVGSFLFGITILTIFMWGGLALYSRETDLIRCSGSSPEVTVCHRKQVVATMKQQEKAQLIWEILQDDDVIRRELRSWWHGVWRFMRSAFSFLPSVILITACLVSWLVPGFAVKAVEFVRLCPAESVIRWAASCLTSMFFFTGMGLVLRDLAMDRLPGNCFHEAFLAKAAAYQQRADDMNAPETC